MLGDSLRCVTFRGAEGGGPPCSAFVPRGEHGGGTPVFLAPAFGLDGRAFERLSPLAAARRLVFWNLPNELPASGGLSALARMFVAHADAAGFPRRLVFGGSSYGGTIALAAALEFPDRCAGLVTIGSAPSWRQLGLRLHIARHALPFLPARGFHRRFATILFGPAGVSEDRDALRAQALHRTKEFARGVVRLSHEGGSFDLGHRIHELRMPVLVVHDPHERVVPEDAADTIGRARTARRADVPGAGHLPYVSRPEDVLAWMTPFLAGVDRRECP